MVRTNRTSLGPYQILSQVGSGGIGEVFRALDTRLGREVAIKFLVEGQNDVQARQRFLREARAASALNHPNIVAIYDVGDIGPGDESPYIVMELVQGVSLRARLRQGPLPVQAITAIAVQIADGLECAHRAGFVHRDLKPENIMLTAADHVKILDFGLAKPVPGVEALDEEATLLTAAGMLLGTPAYMSPEQARGRQAGPTSDQFALGAVLYEMLAGVPPFRRESLAETVAAVILGEPPALPASVPLWLSAVVSRALAKDPLLRYASCHELRAAIGNGLITATAGAESRPPVQPPRTDRAIAVLPFTDLSPEQDQAYFCEGIAEETINALSHVPGLRVVSRNSSFRFNSRDYNLREIADKLHVNSVLEGRVRKVGDRLRITTQLVNVENGFSIWSERFDGQMKDIFDFQDEISSAIVASLKFKLAEQKKDEIKRRYTDNPEAYNAYLKGRYAWNKRTPAGLRAAAGHFEQALAIDPEYALAWTGIADCCIVPSYYGYADPRQLMPRGKAAALKSLEIDPDLAEGHATLGMITGLYEYKWQEAEVCFQRALAINPNHAIARMWYAGFNLAPMGRLEEALREARRARDIDPLNQSVCTVVGMIEYWSRRYEQAILELSNVLELDPNFPVAHYYLALSLHASGRREEALAHARMSLAATDNGAISMSILGYLYAVGGETTLAQKVLEDLERLSRTQYVSPHSTALVHIGLGDLDRAFEALQRGTDEHTNVLIWVRSETYCDALRVDPRFSTLLKGMGFGDSALTYLSAASQTYVS